MILKRFHDEPLAQASYLIACAESGEAVIVDPNRDVDGYIRAAEAEGVEITHVAETHIHADFVSGARELVECTRAELYLSDEGEPPWKYDFAADLGAILLKHGDGFNVGNVHFEALHTPGHTPEHLSFLVTDTARADRPMGILTGDFVFVGDVGRPDLLEKAAGVVGSMEEGARTLFHSLQKFKELPAYLQIWPGHGAGSACGKGIGAVPHSTVGYERMFNWAFSIENEEEFVRAVLEGQPEAPKYFAVMKRINKEGPPLLGGFRRPRRLPESRIADLLDQGALVVDARHAADFAAGHIPGTISIPLDSGFTTWAGWLIPYDRDFYLILDDGCADCVETAAKNLAMIGLDRLGGYFGADAVRAWKAEGRELQSIRQISADELANGVRTGAVEVLDVRGATEWEAGHLPGTPNIFVGHLPDRLDEVPEGRPLVVHCASGARSAVAAGLLQANGFEDAVNFSGGYDEWSAKGYPTESELQSA